MKVLIVGFGKMGNIYSKYLNMFGVDWDYYDPYVHGGLKELSIDGFSHVMISTISEVHFEMFKKIIGLGFAGPVYIDKPAVTLAEHMDIFNYPHLFCGMTERFNPAVIKLKEIIDPESIISLKFSRYSTVPANMRTPVLFDLGIHDLDLYLHLLGMSEFPTNYNIFRKSKTFYIISEQNQILSIFEWSHESHRRERKITILQQNVVYEADLIDQKVLSFEARNTVRNLYVDKAQPLKEILYDFLHGKNPINARLSHEFMFHIIGDK